MKRLKNIFIAKAMAKTRCHNDRSEGSGSRRPDIETASSTISQVLIDEVAVVMQHCAVPVAGDDGLGDTTQARTDHVCDVRQGPELKSSRNV